MGAGVREFKRDTSGADEKEAVNDRKEDKEPSQGEAAARNGEVRTGDEDTRAEQAEQKR